MGGIKGEEERDSFRRKNEKRRKVGITKDLRENLEDQLRKKVLP